MSDHFKKLEGEQVELLKRFDQHLAAVKRLLAEKKTGSAEKTVSMFLREIQRSGEKQTKVNATLETEIHVEPQ